MQVTVKITPEIVGKLLGFLIILLSGTNQDPESVLYTLFIFMGVKKEEAIALLPNLA